MGIMDIPKPLCTHLAMWHGSANPALSRTAAVVIIGSVLFYYRDRRMFIYNYHKEAFTLNYLYDQGLLYSRIGSHRITDGYMTGYIRNYLVYIFGFFTVMG